MIPEQVSKSLKKLVKSHRTKDVIAALAEICDQEATILSQSGAEDDDGNCGEDHEDVGNFRHVHDQLEALEKETYV